MTPSPAHSKWSRPLPEDHGYESPTIGIRIEGPEGAEVAMQVSLDGVQTVDGSHAEYVCFLRRVPFTNQSLSMTFASCLCH